MRRIVLNFDFKVKMFLRTNLRLVKQSDSLDIYFSIIQKFLIIYERLQFSNFFQILNLNRDSIMVTS